MTIFNLGSINIDYIYRLPHLPVAGETLAALSFRAALGGKGANQSIAIARAGGTVSHGGMVSSSDEHWLKILADDGVNLDAVIRGDLPSGHAIVAVDAASGENQIILNPASNQAIDKSVIPLLLETAAVGDWALAQNETNLTTDFLHEAKKRGLRICYSAAPFVASVVADLLPIVDLLIVNEVENRALLDHLAGAGIGVAHLIVTKGSAGATYQGIDGTFDCPAVPVQAVDTTGAGDTYLGYVLAALDAGGSMVDAMGIAAAAAAIQVTKSGASEAIPYVKDVNAIITKS